jgi:hypothetical protein
MRHRVEGNKDFADSAEDEKFGVISKILFLSPRPELAGVTGVKMVVDSAARYAAAQGL